MLFWIPKAWSIKINKIEHILHGRQNVWLKNHYLLNLFDLSNKHFPAPFDNFNNFQQGSSSRGPVSLVFPTSDLKLGRNSISKKMFILISMKCSATDGERNLIWKINYLVIKHANWVFNYFHQYLNKLKKIRLSPLR